MFLGDGGDGVAHLAHLELGVFHDGGVRLATVGVFRGGASRVGVRVPLGGGGVERGAHRRHLGVDVASVARGVGVRVARRVEVTCRLARPRVGAETEGSKRRGGLGGALRGPRGRVEGRVGVGRGAPRGRVEGGRRPLARRGAPEVVQEGGPERASCRWRDAVGGRGTPNRRARLGHAELNHAETRRESSHARARVGMATRARRTLARARSTTNAYFPRNGLRQRARSAFSSRISSDDDRSSNRTRRTARRSTRAKSRDGATTHE